MRCRHDCVSRTSSWLYVANAFRRKWNFCQSTWRKRPTWNSLESSQALLLLRFSFLRLHENHCVDRNHSQCARTWSRCRDIRFACDCRRLPEAEITFPHAIPDSRKLRANGDRACGNCFSKMAIQNNDGAFVLHGLTGLMTDHGDTVLA